MRKTEIFNKVPHFDVVAVGRKGYLTTCDALEFCCSLRSQIADIVFVDPPFNLGKDYGFPSSLENCDAKSYESYMLSLVVEIARILKPGGSLFCYHLPYWATRLVGCLNEKLTFRHWIAVAMTNGFVNSSYLYPAHYALLYYTRGKPSEFKRARIPARRCRKCSAFVKDYGGYTNIIERQGINISDFWDDISPIRHKTNKHRKANQLPIELTDRVIGISGKKGGLLIDPFVGTGTSLLSARKEHMLFVGNDMFHECIEICTSRIQSNK